MITRNEYLRYRLLELTRQLKFQTFELFFPNPMYNTIEREFFIIKPRESFKGNTHWNNMYSVLESETKVVGKNHIINTYPGSGASLTQEALSAMEMIIVNNFNEVDVSEYSYSHKTAYENEYRDLLIRNGGKPVLLSNIIVPIVDRKSHGILSVMNKYADTDNGELEFDEINDDDISLLMQFAAELSRDLTYKFGFRKTIIPSIELSSKERQLYDKICNDNDVIGESVGFQNIIKRIAKVCFSNDPVLLLGSTGVGKTYIAKLIYKYWQIQPEVKNRVKWDTGRLDVKVHRTKYGGNETVNYRFRNINIAAIPETLFESEIFGSVKGAATDIKGRFGVLVEEDGNPLMVLLDEIGDLSMMNQAKLLKCIEEQELSMVGSNIRIPLKSLKIIAATNRSDILQESSDKTLRSDLAYRFKDVIYIPPLEQRVEDIEPLIRYLLKKTKREIRFDKTSINIMLNYSYPGNIRELESIISYTISRLKPNEKIIRYFHLPRNLLATAEYEGIIAKEELSGFKPDYEMNMRDGETVLQDLKKEYERTRKNIIEQFYHSLSENIAQTAKKTGLSEAHIRRIINPKK